MKNINKWNAQAIESLCISPFTKIQPKIKVQHLCKYIVTANVCDFSNGLKGVLSSTCILQPVYILRCNLTLTLIVVCKTANETNLNLNNFVVLKVWFCITGWFCVIRDGWQLCYVQKCVNNAEKVHKNGLSYSAFSGETPTHKHLWV